MSTKPFTVLGFDYGTQKIGIAVGQSITASASALTTISAKDGIPNWQEIEQIISRWQPQSLIIGIPTNMDGSNSPMSIRAEKFSRRLHGRFHLPCHPVDERLSSREARSLSREKAEQEGYRYNPKEHIDSLAAQLILQSWLDENL